MPGIHQMFDWELKKDCFSRCNPNMFRQLEGRDYTEDRQLILCCNDWKVPRFMQSRDLTDWAKCGWIPSQPKGTQSRCFQLRTCDGDILADPFAGSIATALMCDKISAAVRLLMPRVQGIMGCCTDGAEGWWKTVAIALFSLDAGLSVLIRPAAAQRGSILLRWPKVLTQTFQVSVMMPQTCHSCHTTDMTFFWLMRRKKKKNKKPNFTGWGKRSPILPPNLKICPVLRQCAPWNFPRYWFTSHYSQQRLFPVNLLAI